MDFNGRSRPRASRELVERLSQSVERSSDRSLGVINNNGPSIDSGVRRNTYRSSHLGSRHGVRRMGSEIGTLSKCNLVDSKPSSLEHLPSSGKNRRSTGFKEPSNHRYNPFG